MSKSILIIEDNDKNMKLIRDILGYHGFSTIETDNAEDGIVLAKDETPDLIIMDIRLPGMSGNEAMKILRNDERTANIPTIAVTASVMDKDKQDIMSAGFNGYHEKPINHKKFVALVKELVDEDE
jgi:two-component system cell cycle response regulator DivK